MRVCIDVRGEVVFFTPKGKTLPGAPPVPQQPLAEGPAVPSHISGAPRWKRDRDIPWEVEARAWEALDPG
mgnify:CR=1 FL=1